MMDARAHMCSAQCMAAAEQQPEGWRVVPDTILPGYQWHPSGSRQGHPRCTGGPISGKAVGGPNHISAQQYSAETRQTWQRTAGSKSTVDESLLCYGGPRNEEPIEMIQEDCQVHVDSDWVGDLLERKSTTGVIVRRSTKERVLTTSENKTTFEIHCETYEYFHLFINAQMLTITARTHVDYVECTSMVFHSSARLLRKLWRA